MSSVPWLDLAAKLVLMLGVFALCLFVPIRPRSRSWFKREALIMIGLPLGMLILGFVIAMLLPVWIRHSP